MANKRINNMCKDCTLLNKDCAGTITQAFTGCLMKEKNHDLKTVVYSNNGYKYDAKNDTNICPLYTFDFYSYDPHIDNKTGEQYYLCNVIQWTDKTEKATEKGKKTFYFSGNVSDVIRFLKSIENDDDEILKIYNQPQFTKFFVKHNDFYTVNGKTYKY